MVLFLGWDLGTEHSDKIHAVEEAEGADFSNGVLNLLDCGIMI